MSNPYLYKITFYNQNKVYEIFARDVYQGSLHGFIEVEEIVFGERSTVVVDPSEERLKDEFHEVIRTYIPMHAIIRIDEVRKQGAAKITKLGDKGGNVSPFPVPIYTPGGNEGGD